MRKAEHEREQQGHEPDRRADCAFGIHQKLAPEDPMKSHAHDASAEGRYRDSDRSSKTMHWHRRLVSGPFCRRPSDREVR